MPTDLPDRLLAFAATDERVKELRRLSALAKLGVVEVEGRGKRPDTAHNVLLNEDGKIVCDSLNADLYCIETESDGEGGIDVHDQGTWPAFLYFAALTNNAIAIIDEQAALLTEAAKRVEELEQENSKLREADGSEAFLEEHCAKHGWYWEIHHRPNAKFVCIITRESDDDELANCNGDTPAMARARAYRTALEGTK